MNTYKISDVKLVCERITGKEIQHRTWIRWKKQTAIAARSKTIDENEMGRLITYANMRVARPKTKYQLTEILDEKKRVLAEFNRNKRSYQSFLIPETCIGKQLAEIIRIVTGRKLSRAALYRLGGRTKVQYSATATYQKEDVLKLISAIL